MCEQQEQRLSTGHAFSWSYCSIFVTGLINVPPFSSPNINCTSIYMFLVGLNVHIFFLTDGVLPACIVLSASFVVTLQRWGRDQLGLVSPLEVNSTITVLVFFDLHANCGVTDTAFITHFA